MVTENLKLLIYLYYRTLYQLSNFTLATVCWISLGRNDMKQWTFLQFIINLNVAHVLVKRLNTCIWMSHTGSQSEMIKDIDVHLQSTLKKFKRKRWFFSKFYAIRKVLWAILKKMRYHIAIFIINTCWKIIEIYKIFFLKEKRIHCTTCTI